MSHKSNIAACGNGHTVFWMEVLGPDDLPYDRNSFPPYVIEGLKQTPDVWLTQYRLKKSGDSDGLFDADVIRESMYEWVDPYRTIIRYKGFEFDPDKLDEMGFASMEAKESKIGLDSCRFYMHVDAKHKIQAQQRAAGRGGQRPSEAAIAIVAVAPDAHVFLVDYWTDDAGLEGLVAKMLHLYCLWAPYKVTWESVGAQYWLREHIEKLEKFDPRFKHPRARTRFGMEAELPRMTARMVEAEKTNQSKEFVAQAMLSGWVNHRVLHLDRNHHEKPLDQLLNILDDKQAIDLVDCLGQGPAVWEAPPPPNLADEVLRRRAFVDAFARSKIGFIRGFGHGGGTHSGFRRPWAR